MADLERLTQTPEERAQAGYADTDFALAMGVPDWNPVARLAYDPKAIGTLEQDYSHLGNTYSFASVGLGKEDPDDPFKSEGLRKKIRMLQEKYKEDNPEYLATPMPVSINKKLMYLEDPEEFAAARTGLYLGEKDFPPTAEGLAQLKPYVLEHEFTHRGNQLLGRGSRSSGAAHEMEETGTRATMKTRSDFDKAMYEYNLSQYPTKEQPMVSPGGARMLAENRVIKYREMAKERLKELKRWYEDL